VKKNSRMSKIPEFFELCSKSGLIRGWYLSARIQREADSSVIRFIRTKNYAPIRHAKYCGGATFILWHPETYQARLCVTIEVRGDYLSFMEWNGGMIEGVPDFIHSGGNTEATWEGDYMPCFTIHHGALRDFGTVIYVHQVSGPRHPGLPLQNDVVGHDGCYQFGSKGHEEILPFRIIGQSQRWWSRNKTTRTLELEHEKEGINADTKNAPFLEAQDERGYAPFLGACDNNRAHKHHGLPELFCLAPKHMKKKGRKRVMNKERMVRTVYVRVEGSSSSRSTPRFASLTKIEENTRRTIAVPSLLIKGRFYEVAFADRQKLIKANGIYSPEEFEEYVSSQLSIAVTTLHTENEYE